MIAIVLGLVRIGVGLLLLAGARGKMSREFGAGVGDVLGYQIVERRHAELIAFIVPIAELALGGYLMLGATTAEMNVAEAVVVLWLGCLTLAAASVVERGIETDCGWRGWHVRKQVDLALAAGLGLACLLLIADLHLGERRRLLLMDKSQILQYAVMVVGLQTIVRWNQWRKYRRG
ncbi:MauE/DoxX family redox-associated membrane protein [Actinomyces sp. MRS3W]|uniref:MauE/DoxX family redox-associated membrane protein n=1 Tax=Actinomyces sp. MRS3W TaxID=2800796 RepID=UPI0028FD5380|nr:MauE/DoxX family redox-associated membrane protein [Actinomyces sp. MRS3W]MDU0349201.1 hypothetical protein [Actinomyces sp. MRS3W]